jgi:hypothetical protein
MLPAQRAKPSPHNPRQLIRLSSPKGEASVFVYSIHPNQSKKEERETIMNAIVKNFRKLATFTKTLGRDTRGEDLTEKSSGLSNGGKVVIAAVAITGAGAGVAALTNTTNATSDATAAKIAGKAGATPQTSDTVAKPFQ